MPSAANIFVWVENAAFVSSCNASSLHAVRQGNIRHTVRMRIITAENLFFKTNLLNIEFFLYGSSEERAERLLGVFIFVNYTVNCLAYWQIDFVFFA